MAPQVNLRVWTNEGAYQDIQRSNLGRAIPSVRFELHSLDVQWLEVPRGRSRFGPASQGRDAS